jgi:hypothetical protein
MRELNPSANNSIPKSPKQSDLLFQPCYFLLYFAQQIADHLKLCQSKSDLAQEESDFTSKPGISEVTIEAPVFN